ncbi:TAZ zinc finger-domain-containing protein, partial [Ochromonadaceae sp. CCMP2298]
QERLVLLHHASKCPHEDGQCPVTPHCWAVKGLWKHTTGCRDKECNVMHCKSSLKLLNHYSQCKEQTCPVCGPV